MNKDDFTTKICKTLNLDRYSIVKKKHGNVPQITMGELLDCIYEKEWIPNIADSFGVSVQTINRTLRSTFPDIRLTGKRTWKYYLLSLLEIKLCNDCEEYKSFDEFHNNNNEKSIVTKGYICKVCDTVKRTEHYHEKPHLYRASNSKYKAAKLQAIPKWADLEKIKEIYKNCPEGHQVDHEIPLQGVNVCGLHVENNLQYLTTHDNLSKGNRMRDA